MKSVWQRLIQGWRRQECWRGTYESKNKGHEAHPRCTKSVSKEGIPISKVVAWNLMSAPRWFLSGQLESTGSYFGEIQGADQYFTAGEIVWDVVWELTRYKPVRSDLPHTHMSRHLVINITVVPLQLSFFLFFKLFRFMLQLRYMK